MTAQPEALRLADALEHGTHLLSVERDAAAAELRRQWQEIESLKLALEQTDGVVKERLQALESDPDYDYCHRLAILLECMTLDSHRSFDDACALLDEYYAARDKWAEAQGQPYVSGFGKD